MRLFMFFALFFRHSKRRSYFGVPMGIFCAEKVRRMNLRNLTNCQYCCYLYDLLTLTNSQSTESNQTDRSFLNHSFRFTCKCTIHYVLQATTISLAFKLASVHSTVNLLSSWNKLRISIVLVHLSLLDTATEKQKVVNFVLKEYRTTSVSAHAYY